MIAQFSVDNNISHQHFEPKFANSSAKAVWKRAVSAYEKGYPLDYVVTGSRGTYRILLDKERMRQDGDKSSIAYVGKKILLKTSKGKRDSNSPRVALPKLASKVGIDLDPSVRVWAFDLNPMERLVGPGATARVNGALSVAGTRCDLVELSSPGLKINLVLRHSDGLPVRIFSEVRDQKGVVLSTSDRKFSYVSIRKPLPASRFKF